MFHTLHITFPILLLNIVFGKHTSRSLRGFKDLRDCVFCYELKLTQVGKVLPFQILYLFWLICILGVCYSKACDTHILCAV